jgi:hypothetical protein
MVGKSAAKDPLLPGKPCLNLCHQEIVVHIDKPNMLIRDANNSSFLLVDFFCD